MLLGKKLMTNFKNGERFRKISVYISEISGHGVIFFVAVFFVVAWLVSGWFFHFSDTWQLFLNTASSIITFLMVFIIQNGQTRETKRINLKLDELLRTQPHASASIINVEKMSDKTLDALSDDYDDLADGEKLPRVKKAGSPRPKTVRKT